MNEIFGKFLGLPVLASKHGAQVDTLIIWVHVLMLALFVGWLLYFLFTLFLFSKSRNPKADYVGIRGHASNWIEGAVVIAEAFLLFGLAVPYWASAVDHFPTAAENPTTIRIIAQQFNWNIFYPGADGQFCKRDAKFVTNANPWGFDESDPNGKDDPAPILGEFHVPVDKPVIITLTSKDVIHSFKLIAMRVTQDAIPGVPIPLHFTPTVKGVYQINCAQLCGNGHSSMSMGRIYVDSPEDYKKWLDARPKRGAGAALE